MKKIFLSFLFLFLFSANAQADTGLYLGGRGSYYYGGSDYWGVSYGLLVGYDFSKLTPLPLKIEFEFSPKDFGNEYVDGRNSTNNYTLGIYRVLEYWDSTFYLGAIAGVSENHFLYIESNNPLVKKSFKHNYLMYGIGFGYMFDIFEESVMTDIGARLYSTAVTTSNTDYQGSNIITNPYKRSIQFEPYLGFVLLF